MNIAKVGIHHNFAQATDCQPITSGMIGATVSFSFDSTWDGYSKTYVWRAGDVTKDDTTASGIVPHEVLAVPGVPLQVGVYGVRGDVVTPTVWANLGKILPGADPSGDETTDPTPPVWAQLKEEAETAKAKAEEAQQKAAGSAALADLAKVGADMARTAAETAQEKAEASKAGADAAKTEAEKAQQSAESSAEQAAAAETEAEEAQRRAATAQTGAETARDGAVAAKTEAEKALASASTAKNEAEWAKTEAEKAQQSAASSAEQAVTAQTKAEEALAGAVAAQTGAETALAGAEASAEMARAAAASAEWRSGAANAVISSVEGQLVRLNPDNFSPIGERAVEVSISGVDDQAAATLRLMRRNLVPVNYYTKQGTVNGVTFTVREDGSLSANGTATGGTAIFYFARSTSSKPFPVYLPPGEYVLSGGVAASIKRSNGRNEVIQSGESFYLAKGDSFNNIGVAYNVGESINQIYYPMLEAGAVASEYEQPSAPIAVSLDIAKPVSVPVPAEYDAVTLLPDAPGAVLHVDYKKDTNAALNDAGKKWIGKKWAAVGDSLTELIPSGANSKTSKHYHHYIAEETGIIAVDMGRSGSGYAKRKDEGLAFFQRIVTAPDDVDVVTIFGSVNDLTTNMALGDATDNILEADTAAEPTTICGHINRAVNVLFAMLPTVRLGLITPAPTKVYRPFDTDNNLLVDYAKKIVEICHLRGIPCLDLFHCSGLRPWEKVYRDALFSKDIEWRMVSLNPGSGVYKDGAKYTGDPTAGALVEGARTESGEAVYLDENGVYYSPANQGTHPNEEGQALIASRIKAFLETLL
jgi:lysophospholipase L1-like esterase